MNFILDGEKTPPLPAIIRLIRDGGEIFLLINSIKIAKITQEGTLEKIRISDAGGAAVLMDNGVQLDMSGYIVENSVNDN